MLNTFAFIGMNEALIVLVVVLVLFGGKKIPELLRGVGQGVGELQKGLEEGRTQLHRTINETAQATPAPTVDDERRRLEDERRLLEEERRKFEEAKAAQASKIS